jgi:hypothetical protein
MITGPGVMTRGLTTSRLAGLGGLGTTRVGLGLVAAAGGKGGNGGARGILLIVDNFASPPIKGSAGVQATIIRSRGLL